MVYGDTGKYPPRAGGGSPQDKEHTNFRKIELWEAGRARAFVSKSELSARLRLEAKALGGWIEAGSPWDWLGTPSESGSDLLGLAASFTARARSELLVASGARPAEMPIQSAPASGGRDDPLALRAVLCPGGSCTKPERGLEGGGAESRLVGRSLRAGSAGAGQKHRRWLLSAAWGTEEPLRPFRLTASFWRR